ncbi:unnamed protein product [Prorocentrum cordatum]|uniref:Uncharacterized protein n=1 Tax=Prorocentrum cordatum TaxID=2364126 RepID=A0ABN9XL56_9DINO|nr:unnamed protein product [Polarella glacialis]
MLLLFRPTLVQRVALSPRQERVAEPEVVRKHEPCIYIYIYIYTHIQIERRNLRALHTTGVGGQSSSQMLSNKPVSGRIQRHISVNPENQDCSPYSSHTFILAISSAADSSSKLSLSAPRATWSSTRAEENPRQSTTTTHKYSP